MGSSAAGNGDSVMAWCLMKPRLSATLVSSLLVLVSPWVAEAQKQPASVPAASAPSATSEKTLPVVALGSLATRGVSLSPQVTDALKALLHAKLAASGAFRLLPEKSVRETLKTLRREALRNCAAGSCPMELGKALAASRVIVPELVRFGGRCMAVLTIYEVRSATAELATTEACACEESGFLAASLRASAALTAAFMQKTSSGSPASATMGSTKEATKVSIFVVSKPSIMTLSLNGEGVGMTPKLLTLEKDTLRVGTWPYKSVERVVVPRGWQKIMVHVPLDRDDAETVATTREWFAFGLGGGWAPATDEPLFGAELRVLQWRWKHLNWTAFEARFLVGIGEDNQAAPAGLEHITTLATRVAYPIYWGRHGTHQLQFGLAAGLWIATFADGPSKETSRLALALLPALDYVYLLGNGGLSIGVGINVSLPMRSGLGSKEAPLTLSLGLKFGISPEPTLRAHALGKVAPEKTR
ncbi:MAG: hypothetical protein JRH20_28710 [Deltaproteobacteria bacterium]|nr:hypothetical protein [Deltaproteobacteria bacterium]